MLTNVREIFIFVLIALLKSECRVLKIKGSCKDLRVDIYLSSLIINNSARHLEIGWQNADVIQGDFVALFDTDPGSYTFLPQPLYKFPPSSSSGRQLTNIVEPKFNPGDLKFSSSCLYYWVAYIRSNSPIAVDCIRTQPRWMEETKDEIKSMPLQKAFIPGTHDSGAYKEYPGRQETLVGRFTYAQEDDVLTQLIFGSRYVDLRVGFYKANAESVWWVNHGVVKIHPMSYVLDDIKTFLTNTKELVILDIQEFPVGFGSDNSIHELFITYLHDHLSSFMIPATFTWNASIGEIMDFKNTGKLITTYDKRQFVDKYQFLWPAVDQKWGNVQNLSSLYSYTESVVNQYHDSSWSAMAELTPTLMYILMNPNKSLRDLANEVNSNVTEWFGGKWGEKANVVAVDYLRESGIIKNAIEWNIRRANGMAC